MPGPNGLTADAERVLNELGIAAALYRIFAVGVESVHAVNHYEIHSGLAVRIENTCAIPSAHSNHPPSQGEQRDGKKPPIAG